MMLAIATIPCLKLPFTLCSHFRQEVMQLVTNHSSVNYGVS